MRTHDDTTRAALLRAELDARTEVVRLETALQAARNRLAAVQRTLDTRAPGWRDGGAA